MPENLKTLYAQEKANAAHLEKLSPEAFQRLIITNPDSQLKQIGITNLPERPDGFIRYLHQDFIVEEITSDGSIATIEPSSSTLPPESLEGPTIYADLVKIGRGTTEAIRELAHELGIKPEQIGYAGMKDGRALTSQRISIRGAQLELLQKLPRAQQFLKILHAGKGALFPGNLKGNRFTIFVRTQRLPDQHMLEPNIASLATDGFPNFYGVQRFGNRLINADLGRLVCQGKSEEAVKLFLTAGGPNDLPAHAAIRQKVNQVYGQWDNMRSTFDILPYSFRHERSVINHLSSHPTDWTGALNTIPDQIKFWVYGYVSYLVNKILSEAWQGSREIPDPLPLPLGNIAGDELYQPWLDQDATSNYRQHLRFFPYLVQKPRSLNPWIFPKIHSVKSHEAGAILCFSLPKGVYATTFLMFSFRLHEGLPIPDWVKSVAIDTQAVVGIGSVESALSYLDTSNLSKDKKSEKE
jgi:TruD family tRNA pseudouridine synthase